MDLPITFSTTQVDASVALKAYHLYKAGDYKQAIPCLLDILDLEPENWQARLFLGACYFRTEQPMAALRALRYVYENCPQEDLKAKACRALQAANAEMQRKKVECPLEFGDMVQREEKSKPIPIESLIE